jgi:hypothetical protein
MIWGDKMPGLDRPFSARKSAFVACVGLGFAAWILGHRVGMDFFEAVAFAVILAASVGGLVDYVASARNK